MSTPAFALPEELAAREPPERHGSPRDKVRMMVVYRRTGEIVHAHFRDLPEFLEPGDLLVVNNSETLPAALPGRLEGRAVELRLATPLGAEDWVVELRASDLSPFERPPIGGRIELPAGGYAELLARFEASDRLSVARLTLGRPLEGYLRRHGRPIRYPYVDRAWPIDAYQTVFALEPGSVEMPSAGRPFGAELVAELVARGVHLAPVTLHAGVSSPERGEPPHPERYRVPAATARLVRSVRGWGSRSIAVGTTVVRALETVAAPDGTVGPGEGRTSLIVTPERGLRAVDGLLTGWHEPASSHLELLEAAAGPELLQRSYRAARARGYRWHEFGDAHLILP
jgi:S-adenosylmethionine:tRNA ribosyltransferase-isomerase